MSWAGIVSNQTVSFNNLQDAVNTGVFTLKNTIPASNEQITKADADYYVNINTSYAPYAAKSSNQLVVKSDLQPAVVSYAYTIWYDAPCYWDGFYVEGGAATDIAACDLNVNSIVLYSDDAVFQNTTKLYYDSNLSNPWYGDQGNCGSFYRYQDNWFNYVDVMAEVASLTPCCITMLEVSAIYLGVTDMAIVLNLNGSVPANMFQLYFEWCTDSGAFGVTTFTVNAGNSGALQGVTIDLTRTGYSSSSPSWGTSEVTVDTASSSVVNELYVYGLSINFSFGEPGCRYDISYNNADSSCNPLGYVTNQCIAGC